MWHLLLKLIANYTFSPLAIDQVNQHKATVVLTELLHVSSKGDGLFHIPLARKSSEPPPPKKNTQRAERAERS